MKKSTRNLLVILIIALVIVCLFSFNVNGVRRLFGMRNMPRFSAMRSFSMGGFDDAEEVAYDMEAPMVANGAMKQMAVAETSASFSDDNGIISEAKEGERKLVKNVTLSCETKEFDKTYDDIENKVKTYGGIVDNHSLNNGRMGSKNRRRSCNFTIRVPKDKVDSFIDDISKDLNITYKYESVDDITDNYNDTVARLETLKEEESKLNDLIKKAEKVEDMVNIENRLSDVRYQIQSIEKRMNNMDKTVDYSTIYLDITEVVVLTEPKDATPTKDNIIAAFNKNFEDCKIFLQNAGIYIFTHLPAICLTIIAGIILLIILIIICAVSDRASGKDKDKDKRNEVRVHAEKKEFPRKDIVSKTESIKIQEEKTEDEKREEIKVKDDIKDLEKEAVEIKNEENREINAPSVAYKEEKKVADTTPIIKEIKEEEIKEEQPSKKDPSGYTMTDLDFTV